MKTKTKYSLAITGENRLFTFYTLADISISKNEVKPKKQQNWIPTKNEKFITGKTENHNIEKKKKKTKKQRN